MATTITCTWTSETTTPLLVNGYQASLESRNIMHDLIGGGFAVALVGPRPRSGTLELLYETEADAFAALNMHREQSTFTLSDDDRTSVDMTYVINGVVTIALEDETRSLWVVSIGYQEVYE